MLDLLQTLTAYPEWESPEWIEAVATAIRESIAEVKDTNGRLAALLTVAGAAAFPADRERALNAALEEWEAVVSTRATDSARPASIREWLAITMAEARHAAVRQR
jgi:hypothetical protein